MTATLERRLLDEAWGALSSSPDMPTTLLSVTGTSGHLPSRYPVEETAVACVGAALLAGAALHRQRGGSGGRVSVDREQVAFAVRSERYFRKGGQLPGPGFAPLSRFWRTADGWVRTHANYPWHRDALLRTLGTAEAVDPVAAVLAALAARPADWIEERVFESGGIAARVRSPGEWNAHPQGRAVAAEPLIRHEIVGDAPARWRAAGELPASGIRILDLTRVIAGPVCTRFLSALGAEVLRVDPPARPDMAPGTVADTLLGKRSARLDLTSPDGLATLHDLLDGADVVVCGYRPGALERFGLAYETLAERHPGMVVAYLDAWGHSGPWSGRRGFDSVVQAPTGIAFGEGDGEEPGQLPCQLLDHGTGYLTAAAVLDALRRQSTDGATRVVRLSLARTARWLTATSTGSATGTPGSFDASGDASAWTAELDSVEGPVSAVTPPGSIDDRPLRWPSPLTGYCTDAPTWSTSGAT